MVTGLPRGGLEVDGFWVEARLAVRVLRDKPKHGRPGLAKERAARYALEIFYIGPYLV